MTDKISSLPVANTTQAQDKLLLTVYPFGDASSKAITVSKFFTDIPVEVTFANNVTFEANTIFQANTVFTAPAVFTSIETETLVVGSNGIIIEDSFTPSNSSITELSVGKLSWDANYLYIRVANNEIKRVALNAF